MEYSPRYAQPFTFAEAVQLDVSVISTEVTRLQNSLLHLKRTQEELRAAAELAPDPEFTKAMEENEMVIGSQEERISILKLALTEKGVRMGSHYDLAPTRTTYNGSHAGRNPTQEETTANATSSASPSTQEASLHAISDGDEGGVHL